MKKLLIMFAVWTLTAGGALAADSVLAVKPGFSIKAPRGSECNPRTVVVEVDAPAIAKVLLNDPKERIFWPLRRSLVSCLRESYEQGRILIVSSGEILYSAKYDMEKLGCCGRIELDRVQIVDFSQLPEAPEHWAELYWESPRGFRSNIGAITLALQSGTAAAYFELGKFPTNGLVARKLGEIDGFESAEFYKELAVELGHPPALYQEFDELVDEWGDRGLRVGKGYDPTLLNNEEREMLILLAAKMDAQNYWNGSRQGRNLGEVGFDFSKARRVVARYGIDATLEHMKAEKASELAPTATEIARNFNRALVSDRCNPLSAYLNGAIFLGLSFDILTSGDNCVLDGKGIFGNTGLISFGVGNVSNPQCDGRRNRYECTFSYSLRCFADNSNSGLGSGVSAGACWRMNSSVGLAQAEFRRNRDGLWEISKYELLGG